MQKPFIGIRTDQSRRASLRKADNEERRIITVSTRGLLKLIGLPLCLSKEPARGRAVIKVLIRQQR